MFIITVFYFHNCKLCFLFLFFFLHIKKKATFFWHSSFIPRAGQNLLVTGFQNNVFDREKQERVESSLFSACLHCSE